MLDGESVRTVVVGVEVETLGSTVERVFGLLGSENEISVVGGGVVGMIGVG